MERWFGNRGSGVVEIERGRRIEVSDGQSSQVKSAPLDPSKVRLVDKEQKAGRYQKMDKAFCRRVVEERTSEAGFSQWSPGLIAQWSGIN